MARRQRDYAAEYQRRITSGRGRGFHPKEFQSAARNAAAVVPDVVRNAQGQVTHVRFLVTDVKGNQRTYTRKVGSQRDLDKIADQLRKAGAPYLPGYTGFKPRGQTVMTPSGPRSTVSGRR